MGGQLLAPQTRAKWIRGSAAESATGSLNEAKQNKNTVINFKQITTEDSTYTFTTTVLKRFEHVFVQITLQSLTSHMYTTHMSHLC